MAGGLGATAGRSLGAVRFRVLQLCREWCRRSEHFYRVWLEAEAEGFEFTQAEVDDYTEDMEWLNFMIAQPPESPAFARGVQIRRLIPRLGPAPDDVDV